MHNLSQSIHTFGPRKRLDVLFVISFAQNITWKIFEGEIVFIDLLTTLIQIINKYNLNCDVMLCCALCLFRAFKQAAEFDKLLNLTNY